MRKSVIPHRRIIGTNETQPSSANFFVSGDFARHA
jgi:hypothetical protein